MRWAGWPAPSFSARPDLLLGSPRSPPPRQLFLLIAALRRKGALVAAADPLLDDDEIRALDAEPYAWGTASPARAIVTQTGDAQWRTLDPGWFRDLAILVDGRNTLSGVGLPTSVTYRGIGVPARR